MIPRIHSVSRAVPTLLTLVLSAGPAAACDYCLLNQGISPLETINGMGLRVTQRYTQVDEVIQGTHSRPNPGATENFWTTDLSAFMNVPGVEGLLVQANLPVRYTRGAGHVETAPDGSVDVHDHGGDATDIGDLALIARYTFLRRHTLDSTLLLAATAGVKVPTGADHARADDGDFLDAHIQPGTGSTDGLLGLSANYVQGRFGVAANVLATIAGDGEVGDVEHSFGNSLSYDVTGRYRLFPAVPGQGGMQLFASTGIAGETRRREHEDGARVVDSGGNVLYVTPGLQLNVNAHWIAEVSYHHAFHHDLNGTQLGDRYKVFGSLTYLF